MRVKGGNVRQKRHKKLLKATKGYRLTYSKLYRRAHEAWMHAGQYSLAHRRRRYSQMRRLWIKRIGAATRTNGMKYNQFKHKLTAGGSKLNCKMLADIAFNNPTVFTKIVDLVKE